MLLNDNLSYVYYCKHNIYYESEDRMLRTMYYKLEDNYIDYIRKEKTHYMLNKHWYCKECNNGNNCTLACKWSHIKTKNIKEQYIIALT